MGNAGVAMSIAELMKEGRYREVLFQLAPVVEKRTDDPRLWALMGQCFKGLGDSSQALTLFRKADELGFADVGLQFDIASCLYNLRQYPDALAIIGHLNPSQISVRQLRLLGKLLLLNGKAVSAEPVFKKVLDEMPDDPETNLGMARCLVKTGREDESEHYILNSNLQKADNPQVLNSYGEYWRERGNFERAREMYEAALEVDPMFHESLHNLGTLHLIQFRYDTARKYFVDAIKANPENPKTHLNLANAYFLDGRHSAAKASLAKSLSINPGYLHAKELLLTVDAATCEWADLESSDLLVDGADVSTVYSYLSIQDDGMKQLKRALIKAREYPKPIDFLSDQKRASKQKIRLGYFSSDLRDHPVMYLIRQVLMMHDREQFEVYVYHYGPQTNHPTQLEVKEHACRYYDASHWSDEYLLKVATDDQLDIALDLNGHTKDTRTQIFTHRFAPVQVNYLGYPGTSGVKNMDYIIADEVLVPADKESYYSEKIARMPNTYQPNDCYREISDKYRSRKDCGLPESGIVFANFNAPHKIGRSEVAVWSDILSEIPNSVMWLFEANKWAKNNILAAFEEKDVPKERIIFAKRESQSDHLSRLRFIDLFLDSFAYTAHTTASDCLWAGSPVLTMAGDQFAARVGASIVCAAQMPDMVVASVDEYREKAICLGSNLQELERIKQKIGGPKNRDLPLFDSRQYVRDLENIYRELIDSSKQES